MATLCYPSASPRLFEPPSHSSLSKQKSHIAGKLAAVSQSWRRTQAPNSASSKEQSRKTARPNSGNTSHAEPPPKRPRFSVDPSDGDDDSNNDDNNFEPRKKFRLVIKSGEPLFACPFYKRDPIRLCSSPAGHRMIHALKQHILDRHQRSEGECVRCAGRFGNAEALRSHQRQDQICEKRPFDAAQASSMQQLKIEEATRTGTDVEKWFRMWDILFPNIPPPASPYVEPGENEYTAEGRGRARPLPSEPPDHRDAISLPTAEGPPDFASYFQARTGNGAYAISEPQGRKATLNSILMEVDKWIASWPDVRSSLSHHRQPCCDDDQGSTGGTNSSSGTIGGSNGKDSNNGRQRGQKRRRGDERDKRERADGNDGNDDPAPGANEEPYERLSQNELKFACPFLKLYPWIFMHEKHCAGGGWLTTNRLKEHIYRRHLLKETCNRCYEAFDSQQLLTEHQRLDEPCEKKAERPTYGVDAEQFKLLKSRKKLGGSEHEKCQRIYKILRPDIETEDLPYLYWQALDSREGEPPSSEFYKYLQPELPALLQENLDRQFPGETISRSQVVGLVEETVKTLFERFILSRQRQRDQQAQEDQEEQRKKQRRSVEGSGSPREDYSLLSLDPTFGLSFLGDSSDPFQSFGYDLLGQEDVLGVATEEMMRLVDANANTALRQILGETQATLS